MRSHFTLSSGVAAACAVAGATTMMASHGLAQTFVAADYATNPTYAGGWKTNQNGGYGFGPWSFDGTVSGMTNSVYTNGIPNPGDQQGISTASPIGNAWTLFNITANPPPKGPGISNVGRAITEPGGLQPGQTFETIVDNPTGYHFFRGWDILFTGGPTNNPAGDNISALRVQVFAYFSAFWSVIDNDGSTPTPLDTGSTAADGMKLDLTMTSTNTYVLALIPLSNPSSTYMQSGTLTTNLPIRWVNYRLYWGPSSGVNDVADNYEISSMTISGLMLNIQVQGANAILSWPNVTGFYLASTPALGLGAAWSTNGLPAPVMVNGQNIVTNPIAGSSQFFRLQQ
jgi:hypothetical protein